MARAGETRTVYVLGAGFTRAFLPDAPLLIDEAERFGIPSLLERTKQMHGVYLIIKAAMDRLGDGRLNVEELLTRLDGRMPYDTWNVDELAYAARVLKESLLDSIRKARTNLSNERTLARFALHCISEDATCITFNYDDLFDEHLFKGAVPVNQAGGEPKSWNPTYGYGFVCQPSQSYVWRAGDEPTKISPFLLKLHGSLNWYAMRGTQKPYGVDCIKHHADWWRHPLGTLTGGSLELYLENEPFIVPPVLGKSQLASSPLLQVIWWKASWALQVASKVVFIGYSLPVTDIAAKFLFSEGLWRLPGRTVDVEVVDLETSGDVAKRDRLRRAYMAVCPGIPDTAFHYDGAITWLDQMLDDSAL